jgi:formate/nitrite transporter FocA (FNT family)
MKVITVVHGVAIMIFSALVHYVIQAGIANCNSMAGIVSTYTSQDYATGCQTLLNVQMGSLISGIVGAGVVIWGIIRKPKRK